MKLYIRPAYTIRPDGSERPLGFVVCSTNGPPLVDGQIKAHYHKDTAGKEIKADFPDAEWGNALLAR